MPARLDVCEPASARFRCLVCVFIHAVFQDAKIDVKRVASLAHWDAALPMTRNEAVLTSENRSTLAQICA